MNVDPTMPQGGAQRQRSQQLSLQRGNPPTQVPGYEPERFLGMGAYGEVWVAVEKNTGRRVAIKFYAHRGGLDWSLLSREVEKLAFLFADRYVVQLIGVGWDADPPYYIMEYLEHGSLAERIEQGPLPVAEAVELFHDVAVGLLHAHGKGVLHCDLKPANILLDQDRKPRLADFGQSRLSHEQIPALGTLFYMAPEQADMSAVPDARWDVYALGALLYCMLTGSPPHRTPEIVPQLEALPDLSRRLALYRRWIRNQPAPQGHWQLPGVDRALAEIVDRCLAVDPAKRFANVQAVLAALDDRQLQRALRPVRVLGAVGPALLLLVVSIFAWWGFSSAVSKSEEALIQRALDSNRFAAMYVARATANELEHRYEAVESVAKSDRLLAVLAETVETPSMRKTLAELSDPKAGDQQLEPLREAFRRDPLRQRLQTEFEALIPERMRPGAAPKGSREEVASWFFCDAQGISTVRDPQGDTIGKNFAWRSFFHGGPADRERTWRPAAGEHVEHTQPSDVFPSQASDRWIVAISSPVYSKDPKPRFLGVVALTVQVGGFVELQGREDPSAPFAVLVDWRDGPHKGTILQHPLFNKLHAELGRVPDRFLKFAIRPEELPATARPEQMRDYHDPLGGDPTGEEYARRFLAYEYPVSLRGDQSWRVIVQVAYDDAIGSTLNSLRRGLVRYGIVAAVMITAIVVGLWIFALRLLHEASPGRALRPSSLTPERSSTSNAAEAPTEILPSASKPRT